MAKKKPYLNNFDLKAELVKSHERDQLTNKACDMFYLLIEQIQKTLFYKDMSAKEDCASHAIYIICKVWRQFNMELNNPFSWFTSVVVNALKQGWNANEGKPGIIHISLDSFINNDTDSVD